MTPDELELLRTTVRPHDGRCELAAARRAGQFVHSWQDCGCLMRQRERSKALPERPVHWSWLHGPPDEQVQRSA